MSAGHNKKQTNFGKYFEKHFETAMRNFLACAVIGTVGTIGTIGTIDDMRRMW